MPFLVDEPITTPAHDEALRASNEIEWLRPRVRRMFEP
jgi:hypothetical protein